MPRKYPIDQILKPVNHFIHQQKSGAIVLFLAVVVAMLLANLSWSSEGYHHFFEQVFGFTWNGEAYFNYNLRHWINDGLMSIFFFVVGLELKREIVGGELSNPRQALLPIGAAIGGMVFPALIFMALNYGTPASSGWGIPMATDIAFAIGVLYLLGDKVPIGLKVFLTALAIVDDLGAVLVIAFFYTSDINIMNLLIGLVGLLVMYGGNRLGIRNVLFYAILGIGLVWTSFLLSGVHATIAAVLAAFTIPADVKIKEHLYVDKIKGLLEQFKKLDAQDKFPTLTAAQLEALNQVNQHTLQAMTPLQRLEHALHPFVTFLVLPIFALANAGVHLDFTTVNIFGNNIALGVFLGLLAGKVIGIFLVTYLLVKMKVAPFPNGMNKTRLLALGFLAAIGFTMSIFVTTLAYDNPDYLVEAKIGIFAASILGGITGFLLLKKSIKSTESSLG